MKAYTWFLILIVGSFTGCYGDRIISDLLFESYCNEYGRTGQFIYERVGLGEDYFIPIPKDPREVNEHFVVDGILMMNKTILDQD
ncbi:hypothetical protein J3L11_18785, partial [Shewanella sp. 4t3-1-2LB]